MQKYLSFDNSFADNFFDGGGSFVNGLHAGIAERDHADAAGSGADFVGRGVAHDHIAEVVVQIHQFEQSYAPLVAAAVASVATFAAVKLLSSNVGRLELQ